MKIKFVKDISSRPQTFHHVFKVIFENSTMCPQYFLVIGVFEKNPILDEDGHFMYFDPIEDAIVSVSVCDEDGLLICSHPIFTNDDKNVFDEKETLTYDEAWDKLLEYYEEAEEKFQKVGNFKHQLVSFLEARLKEIGKPVVKISDIKDMDIYNSGTYDAYRSLLTQINNPNFFK